MSRRESVADLLTRSGLDRLARLSWRGVLIFNYHRIGSPGEHDDPDLYSCRPEELDAQVRELAARFEVVTAGTCDLSGGTRGRRIAFTFDDGYRDQLDALEVLRRHGVSGSFFITTGFTDDPVLPWWDELAVLLRGYSADLPDSEWTPGGLRLSTLDPDTARRTVGGLYKTKAGDRGPELLDWLSDQTGRPRPAPTEGAATWMTWPMVRRLRDAGMEVGGHSVTHPILATLDADRQDQEIGDSLTRLREELDRPITTFAYPVGAETSFDDHTKEALRRHGVTRAYSFCGGVNRPGRADPLAVLRAGVGAQDTTSVLRATAAVPAVFAAQRYYV